MSSAVRITGIRYAANAFMDKTDVLSKPVNEIIEVKKGKSKKKLDPQFRMCPP